MPNSSAALVPELGGEELEEADGDLGVARAACSARDVEPVAGNERSGRVIVTQQQLRRHDLMGGGRGKPGHDQRTRVRRLCLAAAEETKAVNPLLPSSCCAWISKTSVWGAACEAMPRLV